MSKARNSLLKRIIVILIVVAMITAIIAAYAVGSRAVDESVIKVKLSVGTPGEFSFSL